MLPIPLIIIIAITGMVVCAIIAESVYTITKNLIHKRYNSKPSLSSTVDDPRLTL